MKSILIFLWLLAAFFVPALAQPNNATIDSLRAQLKYGQPDTTLVNLYIHIGQQYEGYQIDSALYFFRQTGKLSELAMEE